MTSYIAINNSEVDPDSPITADLMTKLRDNPIAVFTDDASVPADLKLGVRLLGTLTTTSGASQTLSGLTLTQYKFIIVRLIEVSSTIATYFRIQGGAGSTVNISQLMTTAGSLMHGEISIELASGNAWYISAIGNAGNSQSSVVMTLTSVTTAVTSITFSAFTGTFDAGTIRVYGVR